MAVLNPSRSATGSGPPPVGEPAPPVGAPGSSAARRDCIRTAMPALPRTAPIWRVVL